MKKITIQLIGKAAKQEAIVDLPSVPMLGDILITAIDDEYTVVRRLFNIVTKEIIVQAKYNGA